MSGLAFTASLSTVGIFGGLAADRLNRKWMVGIACIAWSLSTVLTGLIDSFACLFMFRFLLGLFQSVFIPCSYSIIADSFHLQHRTKANSAFNGAIFIGAGIASLSSLIISGQGWRAAYVFVGVSGVLIGILSLLLL